MLNVAQLNQIKTDKWKSNKDTIVVDSKDIFILEKIHREEGKIKGLGYLAKKWETSDIIDKIIVVRPFKDKYALISGLKWLKVGHVLNKPIKCIVLHAGMTHKKYVDAVGIVEDGFIYPETTELIYPAHKISIPRRFRERKPNATKYNNILKYFIEHGTTDKPVTVKLDKNNPFRCIMTNGYIRYLVLINSGETNIPVKFVKAVEDKNE